MNELKDIEVKKNLENAIIKQAARDYLSCTPHDREELRKFFLSRWFGILTRADPEIILKRLDKEVRIHVSERIPITG